MKPKLKSISPDDMKECLEGRGATIHGIPLLVSARYIYEYREEDQGFLLYHFYQPLAYLHTNYLGRKRYLCHPEKRAELESEIRRN